MTVKNVAYKKITPTFARLHTNAKTSARVKHAIDQSTIATSALQLASASTDVQMWEGVNVGIVTEEGQT